MALADYIYQKPVIETERLRIRPMSAADYHLFLLRNHLLKHLHCLEKMTWLFIVNITTTSDDLLLGIIQQVHYFIS